MVRRLGALLLVAGIMAGCGGSSSPAPSSGGNATATPGGGVPAASVPAGDGQAPTLSVTLDGKKKTYPATCTVVENTSIKVTGASGSDSATFVWDVGVMPEATGVMDGVAWTAPDLNASISFASAQAWTFSGSEAETGSTVEGSAICK